MKRCQLEVGGRLSFVAVVVRIVVDLVLSFFIYVVYCDAQSSHWLK
jgi:hypothetical protein